MATIVVGLVEDDAIQADLFSAILEAGGLRPRLFASVDHFRQCYGEKSIDLLLLDWNLPGVSGIDLLKSLRDSPTTYLPIILLTANSDERDIVYGLDCGADDYILKPPRSAELLARIRTVYRRSNPDFESDLVDTAPFEFNTRERELRLNGVLIPTTEREFDLLIYLFRRTYRIVSRQMLLTDVWHMASDCNTRSVDTYVSRLRKSLGLNGESGWLIEGVYQHGYRLVRAEKK